MSHDDKNGASLKARVQEILLAIVNDKEPYRNEAGFTRWGRIQADINAAIDAAFVVSSTRRSMEGIAPQPKYVQHITFEGCDCVVLSPEEYEALWNAAESSVPSAIERNTDPHGLLPLLAPFYGLTPMDAADVLQTLIKDAKRYRWLRDKSEPGICAFYLSVGAAFHEIRFKAQTVDEAIDDQINRADGGKDAQFDIEQSSQEKPNAA